MSPEAWLLLGTVVTALAALVRVWMLIRQQGRQSRTTDAQQIIDQLQEERGAREEQHRREMTALEQRHNHEIAGVRGEVSDLRVRMSRMEDRELAHFDYEYKLRAHIDQRKGPPPPPWPVELMHRIPPMGTT